MIDLRLGDCLEIMRDMPAQSVDAVITDPPYNVGLDYSDGDNREDYPQWCSQWFSECKRIARGGVAISSGIVNLGAWHNIEVPYWIFSWNKPNSMKRSRTGWNTWEPILLYGKPLGKRTHDSFRVSIVPQKDTGDHPCPKPIGWATELIDRMTKEGMTVLDCFMGSGTTGVACARLNRNFIGIEINPTYFEIAQRRITEAQAQLTLNLG